MSLDKFTASEREMILNGILPGSIAFEMYATRGLPVEAMEEWCEQHDFRFDREAFDLLCERHRALSRVRSVFSKDVLAR